MKSLWKMSIRELEEEIERLERKRAIFQALTFTFSLIALMCLFAAYLMSR